MKKEEITPYWDNEANNLLAGRKIVGVKYVDTEEAERYGWYNRPVSFILDNGNRVIVQMDDEGNDGGALWIGSETEEHILPVLSLEDK